MNMMPAAHLPPDLRHIETWIFDLDNTLYPPGSSIFPQVHALMSAYISDLLHVPEEEAKRIRRAYYLKYGTTMAGLMAEHGTKPDDFLMFVHDIDLSELQPDARLCQALDALPGRKIVFTNASREHAERVLFRLGLDSSFDSIWDIRDSCFVPKPAPETYEKLIVERSIEPRTAIFFEDIERNLKPAHDLGMTTVWLKNEANGGEAPANDLVQPGQNPAADFPSGGASHISYETAGLADFLMSVEI